METIIDTEHVNPVLNEILRAELAGVVRYTHYSLVITGPNRLPLVDFMRAQAAESLLHAQQVGEILTGLGGHPTRDRTDRGIARPLDRDDPARVDRARASGARPLPSTPELTTGSRSTSRSPPGPDRRRRTARDRDEQAPARLHHRLTDRPPQ